MDLMGQPPSGQKQHQFVLLLNKLTGSPRVQYLMVDPGKPSRLLPKINSILLPRIKELSDFRATVMNNCIYIIGGRKTLTGEILRTMTKFDPSSNQWTRCAQMIRPRIKFTANVLENCLYVVGGESKGGNPIEHMECYDPLTDTWTEMSPLPKPRSDHASCVAGGKLIIAGGRGSFKQMCSNVLWRYSPRGDRWETGLTSCALPEPREKHALVSYKDKVYCIGGLGYDAMSGVEVDISHLCCLNSSQANILNLDQVRNQGDRGSSDKEHWDPVYPDMVHTRSLFAHIILGHNIYIFGGHHFGKDKDTNMIEYFNTKKRTWRETFSLGEHSYANVDACLVSIPASNKEFSTLGITMHDKWILW